MTINARITVTGIGPSGRSITNATVDDSGHLILTFSDSTTLDAGLVGGVGGGDAMPQPSAPFLFHRDFMSGIGWDGLDVDGNPMPDGFARLSIQAQTDVVSNTWDTAVDFDFATVADGDPWDPTSSGWTPGPTGIYLAAEGTLQAEGLGESDWSAWLGQVHRLSVTCNSYAQRLTTRGDGLAQYYFLAGSTNWANWDGIIIVPQSGSTAIYSKATGGGLVLVDQFAVSYPAAGAVFEYDGVNLIMRDAGDQTLLGTSAVGTHRGHMAAISVEGQPVSDRPVIEAAEITAGPWAEIGSLAGAGTSIVSASGTVRSVALNLAGTAGPASSTVSIDYPTTTVPSAMTDLTDVSVDANSLAGRQALTWDGAEWGNHDLFYLAQGLRYLHYVGDFAAPSMLIDSGAVVTYNGHLWMCIIEGTGNVSDSPDVAPQFWQMIA